MFHHDPAEDERDAALAAARYGLPTDVIRSKVARLRERFAGLQYRSRSWSFAETIGFAPMLDLDDEDPEPMVSLIEHAVAYPFGVWATNSRSICGGPWARCSGRAATANGPSGPGTKLPP